MARRNRRNKLQKRGGTQFDCARRGRETTFMEFFIPAAKSPAEAEKVWEATRNFAKESLGWEVSDRRIFRVEGIHEGKAVVAEVGQPDPYVGEIVVAILKSNAYLVCTANRGVLRGEPILVGTQEVEVVTDFDSSDD